MDTSEAGRLGAAITNKKLTPESRKAAAIKGWKNRKKRLRTKDTETDEEWAARSEKTLKDAEYKD